MKIKGIKRESVVINRQVSSPLQSIQTISDVVYGILTSISSQFAFYITHLKNRVVYIKDSLVSLFLDKIIPNTELVRGRQGINLSSRAITARRALYST